MVESASAVPEQPTVEVTQSVDIIENLSNLNKIISQKTERTVQLMAVSKTKPVEAIEQAYTAGQRIFGENYVDEFCEKSTKLSETISDIKWHFIGHLQSNKVKKLLTQSHNLYMIESVHSQKLADELQKQLEKLDSTPLNVLVQVATGDEDTKSGISLSEAQELVAHITSKCSKLKFRGLMAMGKLHDRQGFVQVQELKNQLIDAGIVQLQTEEFEISMGTSADFEMAIEEGATRVRLGTTIFGARKYQQKKPSRKEEE